MSSTEDVPVVGIPRAPETARVMASVPHYSGMERERVVARIKRLTAAAHPPTMAPPHRLRLSGLRA